MQLNLNKYKQQILKKELEEIKMFFGAFGWLIGLVAMIWVIYDVFTNRKKMETSMKVMWTILAVFFSIITAIVYYFVVYNKK